MEKSRKAFLKYIFLSPIAKIWEGYYFIRRALYDYGFVHQMSFRVPIISIGNLAFGGTGKTPFTLWLAEYLQKENKKVMIVMRGYKGKLEKDSGIIYSGKKINPDPVEYGDEALIYARRLENAAIVVGKNRSANLKFYFPKFLPDIVLLDDGHQHLKLKRKLNILLFDALMPLEKYQVAPLGFLREGFSALKDADLVVIGRADQASRERIKQLKSLILNTLPHGVAISEVGFKAKGFLNSSYDFLFNVDGIKNKNVICMAGLASPQSFYNMIEEMGANIISTETFPDHHYYSKNEIEKLLKKAKENQAFLLTTEKDMVRIKKVISDERIIFLQVDIKFLSGEEEAKNIMRKVLN